MVDSSGRITARGDGSIAGWQIRDNRLFKDSVGMAPDNWKHDEALSRYTGVFWAGGPNNNDYISVNKQNFAKRNFFVTKGGYLFSKSGQIAGWHINPKKLYNGNVGMAPEETTDTPYAFWAGNNFYVNHKGYLFSRSGNIGGWNISVDSLSRKTNYSDVGMSVGGKEDKDSSPICFWAGTSPTEKNFYVRRNGYLFSKYGQIGNWFIGEGGLYSKGGDKKFTKDGSGVYVGSDGIRLGSNFYVETSGKIYALTGNIGNCDISSGGISQKDGAWSIDASGSAKFTNATINGKSIIDLVGFKSTGGAGGGTTLGGGATINPGAGGVTVPNGKTLDKHTE